MRKSFLQWIVGALAVLAAGCSDTPTAPSTSSYTSTTQFFSNVLAPAGTSAAFTFTTTTSNAVAVTLASLTDTTGEPVSAQLTLNLGTVSGTTCAPTTASTVTGAVLTAGVTASLPAGNYCVSVADQEQLAASTDFTIRVVTSSGTAPAGTAATDQMPSTLTRGGSSVKTFTASAQGATSLTLSSVEGDLAIEVGLGVWDGSACRLNMSVVTVPGTDPQIQTNVDAGSYCVRLADVGNLTHQVSISGTILHP